MNDATMEREYLDAMNLRNIRLADAGRCLDVIRANHSDLYKVRLLDAHYAYHVDTRNYGQSLHTIIHDIIAHDDVPAGTMAMAYVVATNLAMVLNDSVMVNRLASSMASFWPAHVNDASVYRWRFGCELNVAMHVLRKGDIDRSITLLNEIIDTLTLDPIYSCWATQVHTNLAVAYARKGDVTMARHHAETADELGMSFDSKNRLYAWGEIAIAESNWNTARALLINAYHAAKAEGDPYIMAYAQVLLCRVFREIDNIDAFWYAYERAHDISRAHGVPHVFGVTADLAAGVPLNIQEEVNHA